MINADRAKRLGFKTLYCYTFFENEHPDIAYEIESILAAGERTLIKDCRKVMADNNIDVSQINIKAQTANSEMKRRKLAEEEMQRIEFERKEQERKEQERREYEKRIEKEKSAKRIRSSPDVVILDDYDFCRSQRLEEELVLKEEYIDKLNEVGVSDMTTIMRQQEQIKTLEAKVNMYEKDTTVHELLSEIASLKLERKHHDETKQKLNETLEQNKKLTAENDKLKSQIAIYSKELAEKKRMITKLSSNVSDYAALFKRWKNDVDGLVFTK